MKKLLLLLCLLSAVCGAQTKPSILSIDFIENIAELRTTRPSASAQYTAIVNGYATRSDGGGGVFIWSPTSTAADDGGLVIRPTTTAVASAGRWLRDCEPNVVNVRHFGAIGDGVITEVAYVAASHSSGIVSSYTGLIHEFSGTDDSAAFQRAYAAMDTGKTLYIPSGNFVVDGNDVGWKVASTPGMLFDGLENITIRGDGPSSRVLVKYDVSTEPTEENNTFVLFNFKGCSDVLVRDLNIDFQCLGWSTVQVSGYDTDTRKAGAVIFGHNGTAGALRNVASNLTLRVNHPFGAYFGDAYAPGKYSTKLFAIFIYGYYGAVGPLALTYEPVADAIMADLCEVSDCHFYNGQPYSIMLWMTDNTKIMRNSFLDSGGQLPVIRCPHLHRNTKVHDNFIEIVPRYSDGAAGSHCIAFFNNSGYYLSSGVSICNNNIILRDGVRGISAIDVISGDDFLIDGNIIKSEDTATSSTTAFSAIRVVEDVAHWTALGGMGEARNFIISNNTISGPFYNGILAECLSPTVIGNSISLAHRYGIFVVTRDSGIITKNNIDNVITGILANLPATSTANVSIDIEGNKVNHGTTGIGVSGASTDGLFLIRNNTFYDFVTGMAGGVALVVSGRTVVNNCAISSCTTDLDAAFLNVASMTIDLTASSSWKIYGRPGVATTGY